jgi:hypothetical protein
LAQISVSTLILVGRSSKLVPTPSSLSSLHEQNSHTDTCTVLLISQQCGPEVFRALQKFRKFLLLLAALRNCSQRGKQISSVWKHFWISAWPVIQKLRFEGSNHSTAARRLVGNRGPDQLGASGEPQFTNERRCFSISQVSIASSDSTCPSSAIAFSIGQTLLCIISIS